MQQNQLPWRPGKNLIQRKEFPTLETSFFYWSAILARDLIEKIMKKKNGK